MNNQEELEQLKKRVAALEAIVQTYGIVQENQPIKMAAIALGQSEWMIRKIVKESRLNPRKHRAKIGTHYSFNGNRLLINVKAWERDVKSVAPENC